jgi:hypothetical protein
MIIINIRKDKKEKKHTMTWGSYASRASFVVVLFPSIIAVVDADPVVVVALFSMSALMSFSSLLELVLRLITLLVSYKDTQHCILSIIAKVKIILSCIPGKVSMTQQWAIGTVTSLSG